MNHPIVLQGRRVRVESLSPEHMPELREIGNDPSIWQYTFSENPFTNDRDAGNWFAEATLGGDTRTFAVIDCGTGKVAGSTRFYGISEKDRKLEIGYTFYGTRYWRTAVNTETKLLLLSYAFEEWNAERVQLTAEAINARSHRAILRIGATHEGLLRSYRIRSTGEVRDVNIYSIVKAEWPAVKARLVSLADRTRDIPAAGSASAVPASPSA
ncbi:MAG TPA: GNAT family protein [Candidatus Baltobacteraceae bacterium]|nr:GNAT family protein [Candidatus Baltobacteraceae bacterium]